MMDFRVIVTEKCNANCPTCFNKQIRIGTEMPILDFLALCQYLKEDGKVEKLKIMGGEPTVHGDFASIVSCAQNWFDGVHIFTNAINDKISLFEPRDNDSIIYNVGCLSENFSSDKLLLGQRGQRVFETQVASECNIDKIKKVLRRGKLLTGGENMKIALTLNCVEDIFAHRAAIIAAWNELSDFIHEELQMEHGIDHNVPYCFFMGSEMKIRMGRSLCNLKCAGLITADLRLHYCNQSHDDLGNIRPNGRFLPFSIVMNRLREFYYKKMTHNLGKLCRDCVLFEEKCNGGCFMHKELVKKSSIVKYSSLPFRNSVE